MLGSISPTIFSTSKSINMTPFVSAEWNQNLFNKPYITLPGDGSKQSLGSVVGTISDVTGTNAKANFTTKSFQLSSGTGSISYPVTVTGGNRTTFKILTYVRSNTRNPIMINVYGKGTSSQFGSSSAEVNSFGWTKIETYVSSSSDIDYISSFNLSIVANTFGSLDQTATIYYTVPEVYNISRFSYQYGSLWSTDDVFTYFRPGESYVPTGTSSFSFPANYRKVNNLQISGYAGTEYMPISAIFQNPKFVSISNLAPLSKNVLASDMNQYKYFVSDTSSKSICAVYETSIITNKIVIKFNTSATIPSINIYLNDSGTPISVDGSTSVSPDSNGLLVLYWNGTSWTKTKWASMPKFGLSGTLSISTNISKIVVTQIGKTVNSRFSSISNTTVISELDRMQIVEVSPRVEIDLTDFVESIRINKSLDSKNNAVPISSIDTNDASISFSGIPLFNGSGPILIFSNESNMSSTILANMLRKNVKIYINFILNSYVDNSNNTHVVSNTVIPGGVFYTDSWMENDIDSVSVQAFDISRYLQTLPVPDYVANLKNVFEIISNILEMAGFSDYDYDSLYNVCNDKSLPLDLSYYFCNSKDTTVIDALSEIFLAYQIGAYIDEYGIMKFLSLSDILYSKNSLLSISDLSISDGGITIENGPKVGKLSVRYQPPKIRQSPAVQNIDPTILNSPSFIYTTANTVVWAQESADSIGFNYLTETMDENENKFKLNPSDALDIFKTFSLNSSGYAAIEDEIVSFKYKKYKISTKSNPLVYEYVSVKNDIELASEINRFTKKYQSVLNVSVLNPQGYPVDKSDYDILVEWTGEISNVERGLFGSKVSTHKMISDGLTISEKGLSEAIIDDNYGISGMPSGTNTSIYQNSIQTNAPSFTKVLIYPTTERDIAYKDSGNSTYGTYSTKIVFSEADTKAAGIFFNLSNSLTDVSGTYFVEFISYKEYTGITTYKDKYIVVIYRYISGSEEIVAWADVSGQVKGIIDNFEKVISKQTESGQTVYIKTVDKQFNLKVVHYNNSDTLSGEDIGELIQVFINTTEVIGWQVPQYSEYIRYDQDWIWEEIQQNTVTGLRKKVVLPTAPVAGNIFGAYTTSDPIFVDGLNYELINTTIIPAFIREIHATDKPLVNKNVSYYYQDQEFLNGMVNSANLITNSKTYIMQTRPEVSGINFYDIQYSTPAATSTDILPVEYLMYYFPGTTQKDQKNYDKKIVDENSLAYSTVVNTGYRARFAIANNSKHMVFLKHDSDELIHFTNVLNLWTHELIAPAEPEIIERVIDQSNSNEVAQIDSVWIQSKDAAERIIATVAKGIDGFTKTISLNIFGNPLIQVGDVITLTYPLKGINQQKYLVHSVSQDFDSGLSTSLVLNMVDRGLAY